MKSPYTTYICHLFDTVAAFRLGMEGEANENFTKLIDVLDKALQNAPVKNRAELSLILAEVFAAQQRQDYLNIADLLEYRLAPLLSPV